MSSAKQLPCTRSFSVVEAPAPAPARAGRRIGSSRHIIPAMVTWLTLQTLSHFIRDVACSVAELLLAGLSWLWSEFLAGCAVYAEAMHPMPVAIGHPGHPVDQALSTPAPATSRPRLAIVSDATPSAPRHDLPKQIAVTGPTAVCEWPPREPMVIRSASGLAPRRNNGPR